MTIIVQSKELDNKDMFTFNMSVNHFQDLELQYRNYSFVTIIPYIITFEFHIDLLDFKNELEILKQDLKSGVAK